MKLFQNADADRHERPIEHFGWPVKLNGVHCNETLSIPLFKIFPVTKKIYVAFDVA